jgi:hypothetical protein
MDSKNGCVRLGFLKEGDGEGATNNTNIIDNCTQFHLQAAAMGF